MRSEKMGDDEFHIFLEEAKRGCVPVQLCYSSVFPALFINKNLGSKKQYENRDVDTVWSLAQSNGLVVAVFMDIEFEGAGHIRVCFEKFDDSFLDWLRRLIEAKGCLALIDSPPTVVAIEGISVEGVPLDIPELLINSFKIGGF